jgi:hypothetical protein
VTLDAMDARYAGFPSRIYLPVPRLDSTNSSAALASIGQIRGFTLADAQNHHIATAVDFPSSWHTYSVDVHWCNRSTNTGNVCMRIDTMTLASGTLLTNNAAAGAQGAFAAAGQWVQVVSTVAANVAVDPAGPNLVRRPSRAHCTIITASCTTARAASSVAGGSGVGDPWRFDSGHISSSMLISGTTL